jgi:Tfp pilus assembly protein PilO
LIAGAAVAGVLLLIMVVLVLPKMKAVTEAEDRLDAAKAEQTTLTVRREALQDAKATAGQARAIIRDVEARIPRLADEPGLLLLLQNAAQGSGLEVASFAVGEPTFDADRGISVIQVTVAAEGTYFEVADFLYSVETLPRAAKMTAMSLAPSEEGTGTIPTLTLSGTLEVYTSDANAGTGSIPGTQSEAEAGV